MHAIISLCFMNVFNIAFCPYKISFIVLNFETSNGGIDLFVMKQQFCLPVSEIIYVCLPLRVCFQI